MVNPSISAPSHLKAQIVNHPVSCISKLHPHTIAVTARLTRPQPAWLLFLRSQMPPNANVYLIILPYISFQYIIYSVHKGSHALTKCHSSVPCVWRFNPLSYITDSISTSIGLLIILRTQYHMQSGSQEHHLQIHAD